MECIIDWKKAKMLKEFQAWIDRYRILKNGVSSDVFIQVMSSSLVKSSSERSLDHKFLYVPS